MLQPHGLQVNIFVDVTFRRKHDRACDRWMSTKHQTAEIAVSAHCASESAGQCYTFFSFKNFFCPHILVLSGFDCLMLFAHMFSNQCGTCNAVLSLVATVLQHSAPSTAHVEWVHVSFGPIPVFVWMQLHWMQVGSTTHFLVVKIEFMVATCLGEFAPYACFCNSYVNK